MAHKLGLAGCRLWTTEAKQSGGQYRGGVGLAVKATLRARHLPSFSPRAGQAVAVHLDNVIVVSIWKGHEASAETEDFLAFLEGMHLQPPGPRNPIALIGDWNWQPQENLVLQDDAFTFVAVQEGDELLPTRWQGRRAIDYALLSPNMLGSVVFMDEAFGDHKGVTFQMQCNLVARDFDLLEKRLGWSLKSCPEMAAAAQHLAAVRRASHVFAHGITYNSLEGRKTNRQAGRKEGKKERRKEGKKERRKEGKKERRKEGKRKNGKKES
eukprot:s410_g7.t1